MKKIIYTLVIVHVLNVVNAQWVQLGTIQNTGVIKYLATDGTNILAGCNGLFQTSNNGANWNKISNVHIKSIAINCGKIYYTNDSTFSYLYSTINNGLHWDSLRFARNVLTNDSIVFIGTWAPFHLSDPILYISNDNGLTWIPKVSSEEDAVSILEAYNSRIIAISEYYICISANNGLSWNIMNNNFHINSLAINNTNIFIYDNNLNTIFMSIDDGQNWNLANSPNVNIINSLALYNNDLYAGTDSGVFVSNDSGMTWNSFNNGFIYNEYVNTLLVYGNVLYAGTNSGVWKYTLPQSINKNDINNNINIYPNPTKETLNITNAEKGDIHIYNVLGEEVMMVNSRDVINHVCTINVSSLTAGTYIVKVVMGSGVVVRKLIIVD